MARPKAVSTEDYVPEAQTVERDSLPPAQYTGSWSEWSETKLAYPREVYKGDYYRVTGSQEEHFSLLRSGWSDERGEDHPYIPISAHPDSIAKAQRGIQELRAKAAAESAKFTPQVTKDLVAEMIEKQLAERAGLDRPWRQPE